MLPTLSRLTVSCRPVIRLRHWCSSLYLRISPLHKEFRLPLRYSRKTFSNAVWRLSLQISHLTCLPGYTPFTPSKSGQRLPPTYYRGCWHVVSRGLFSGYRLLLFPCQRSLQPESLLPSRGVAGQTCVHCPIFPTAASRRSLGRISVPMWPVNLSVRLLIVALVGRYLTNKLIRREAIFQR